MKNRTVPNWLRLHLLIGFANKKYALTGRLWFRFRAERLQRLAGPRPSFVTEFGEFAQ